MGTRAATSKRTERDGFVLMRRDLEMFRSLAEARFLSVEALEWLHFPFWRGRYVQWQQRQAAGCDKPYIPSAQLYSRLRRMEAAKLVWRTVRPVERAVRVFKCAPDLWALDQAGGEWLATYLGCDPDELDLPRPRLHSGDLQPHTALIGMTYAAIRATVEVSEGCVFHDWRNDVETAKAYDRVATLIPQGHDWRDERLSVQPDGVFVFEQGGQSTLYFLEVERRHNPEAWKRKVWAWEAYTGSAELRARYGHSTFVVLAATETAGQRQNLMRHTGQALWQRYRRRLQAQRLGGYLFATTEDVHPLRIGDAWLRIGSVTPHEQRLPNGGVYERVTVEAEGVRLVQR